MFQTGIWFCCKCSKQTGVWFWWKLDFRQHFGFIFSIPIFCKNTKGDGGSGGGGGGGGGSGGGSGGGLGCW